MRPEEWARVRDVFERAMSAAPEERDRVIEQASADDAATAAQVRAMVEAAASDGRLELVPPVGLDDLLESPTHGPDDDLGLERYRIIRRLGEGGMGVVYEAERSDGVFDKRVAVKVLKRGMDSALFLRRFEAERAALARLDHPNIARMIDAGTTIDGRPYLVMELVEGHPVDRFCANALLHVHQRIELFLQVCSAVAYAHRNLVLHRDLKPGNIFVTDARRVKLLDFGIAKMLGPDLNDVTVTRERLLTPRYASPEMADGTALTTASDVYSLGVVLYELLTGLDPYDVDEPTPRAYERAVREQIPLMASAALSRRAGSGDTRIPGVSTTALRRMLRGDLDVILMKALAKEPDRRYQRVEALADDLRAYLAGRPVAARPDSLLYRTRKLVRRAPAPTGIVTAAIIAVLSLAVYAMIQRSHALDAAARAELRFHELERQKAITDGVNEFYTAEVLGQADPDQSMAYDITVAEALNRAAASIDERFADAPLVEAKIRHSIGYFFHQRSEYAMAEPQLLRAWRLYDAELGREHPDTVLAKRDYGNTLHWLGRNEESLTVLTDVLDVQRRQDPDDGQTILTVSLVGAVLTDLSRYAEAADYLEEAYEWRRAEFGERHGNTMTSMNNLAYLYVQMREFDRALPLFQRATELRTESLGPRHPRTLIARANLASLLAKTGRVEEAIQELKAVRADQLEVLGPDHGHTRHVRGQLEMLGVDTQDLP